MTQVITDGTGINYKQSISADYTKSASLLVT